MYTPEQINLLVAEKIKIFKDAESNKKFPEYTEVYKDSVDYYERISVHAEIGKFPDAIFKTRAPNQSVEEFEYMKANYETTTYPIWTRFLGVLNRMWNDQNWSILWTSKDTVIEGKEYLETKYPIYGSLEAYFKSIFTKDKVKDANGVICHKPYRLPIKQDEEGNLSIDDTKLIDYVAVIYNSPQVIGFQDSEYALIELCEKSVVDFGGSKQKIGKVFEFYDEFNIWRIVQIGKKIDYKFDVLLYWEHNLGYLPVKKLGGEAIPKENEILYQSKFMAAIGPMNLVLLDSSYLQAAKAGHAFPHKWEYVDECDYNNGMSSCIEGRILTADGKETNCPSCQGTGKRNRSSPLGVTQVKAPNANSGGDKISAPFFGWESPDPTILNFLRSEIEKNSQIALSILNLNVSDSDVKGSETALGKKIDREEMMSAIQGESDEVFSHYEFSNKCILQMRHGLDVELPSISYPKTFSIRSEADLTEEIGFAKEKGLPDVVIRKLIFEYMATRFNSQDETEKAFKLAAITDRLLTLSSLEIANKKLSHAIANWQDILHTCIYSFIEELAIDPKFFEKDITEQRKILIKMAKDMDAEINPSAMNVDAILADVNGESTPSNVEAEAKARLKGSVGGVQGLIQIQTSVSSGITDYEAAVTMLFEIYGFDDVTARKLLGNPVDLATTSATVNG